MKLQFIKTLKLMKLKLYILSFRHLSLQKLDTKSRHI